MAIDERVAFAKEADYQYLKGKHEGIKLALGILKNNVLGQDVNVTYNKAKFGTSHRGAIRWLAKEKEIIENQIENLEISIYATTYKPMTVAQKAGWPFNAQGEEE